MHCRQDLLEVLRLIWHTAAGGCLQALDSALAREASTCQCLVRTAGMADRDPTQWLVEGVVIHLGLHESGIGHKIHSQQFSAIGECTVTGSCTHFNVV